MHRIVAKSRAMGLRRRPAMLAALSLGMLAWACKDSPSSPPPCVVSSVTISPGTGTVQSGSSIPLTANVVSADCSSVQVTWSSSSPQTASLSATSGTSVTVSGGTPGSAVITASAAGTEGSASGTATITVTPVPVASVTVSPATQSLQVGQSGNVSAEAKDASGNVLAGRDITWATNNASVANVTGSGASAVISAQGPGTATITARSEGREATATVTVSAVPVASVTVAPASLTFTTIGSNQAASAKTFDAGNNELTGRTITWQTSNPAVADVTGTGANVVVNARGPGSAVITATSEGKNGALNVSVGAAVASVTIDPLSATVAAGSTRQIAATLKDAAGNVLNRTIVWSSTNTGVAEVSATGLLTAKSPGTTTVTATSENVTGTASFAVVVALAYAKPDQPTNTQYAPPGENFMGGATTVTRKGAGQYLVAFDKMSPSDPIVGAVTAMVNATSPAPNATLTAPGAYCELIDFTFPGATTTVELLCRNPATGLVADSKFEVMVVGKGVFGGPTAPGQNAMFSRHNNFNATVPYAPPANVSWNSLGTQPTIGSQGGGVWRHNTGLNLGAPYAMMVTPYLQGDATCNLGPVFAGPSFVDVICRTAAGAPPTAATSSRATWHTALQFEKGRPGADYAYAFYSDGALSTGYSSNAKGQILVTPQGIGKWSIAFLGFNLGANDNSFIMVTPYSGVWSKCSSSLAGKSPVTVEVACFGPTGAFQNTFGFNAVVIR